MVSTSSSLPIFLTELGLTTTEQSLYLCGLKSPEASVKELVRESGINRTTAYHALDTLKQKGFTRESKRQGTLYYRMTPPSELSQLLTARQASLEAQKHKLIEMEYLFPVPSVCIFGQ
jgi:sugar-specific transcriptional regulator TrmB